MRIAIALLLLVLAPAASRAAPHGRHFGEHGAGRDTTRILPRWLHAYAALGPGWLQSPDVIRSRYSASIGAGLGLNVRPRPAFDAALEFRYLGLSPHDATYYGFYDPNSVAPGVELTGGGYGHLIDLVAIASVRPYSNWWLEGGAGGTHFSSGYPDYQFVDIVSGRVVDVPGKSGWGTTVLAGSRIEFQPTARDRMFVEGLWSGSTVRGNLLGSIALRAGYRFP